MPTPKGLPKVGEIWEWKHKSFNGGKTHVTEFLVQKRGGGVYWALWVRVLKYNGDEIPVNERKAERLWVDASYFFKQGEYRFLREGAK